MSKRTKILIVDDNKKLCDSLRDILEDDGYAVESANNGKDAINLSQNNRYDIALVDFKLPDISGTELVNDLVSISPSIEFILITAYATLDSAIEAVKQERVISYELKPLDMGRLLSILNQAAKRRKAEEEIRKLYHAINQSSAMVMITDNNGNIEYTNLMFTQLTGYSLEEAIGENPRILKSGKISSEVYRELWKTIISGNEWHGEFRNKKKNGELYWELASISSMKNPDGVITNFIKVAEDITERKRTERSIYSQAMIIDQIHDSVVSTDPDGFVTSWNKGAERLFGYSSGEMLSRHIAIVYPEEEHAFLQNEVIVPLQAKGVHEVEVRMQRKSGEEFYAHLSLSMIYDEYGNSTGMIGYSMDITERVQAERQLRKYRERLEKMVEDRTTSLTKTNVQLNKEIIERKQAEDKLRVQNSYLKLLQVAAVAANESIEIKDAFQPVLGEICNYTNWGIGHAYVISKDDPDLLEPTSVWWLKDHSHFKEFCDVSKETRFTKGVGLPGRVLANGKPHWIVDVTKDKNFLRTKISKYLNIKSGIAFPVMVGTKVVAVLEFFTTDAVKPDQQFMGIIADVGTQLGRVIERKHAEEQIKVSLKEKEALLMEIHHRVRNNLQIISSLFSLHTMKIKDEQNIKIFKDAQNRIQSMAAIQEMLYKANHLSDVDFYQYVELLTDRLFSSFGIDPGRISLKINIKDVSLKIEQAIPVGLLVNELLSNSLEHAFPFDKIRVESFDSDQVKQEGKQEEREIRISLTPAPDNKIQLIACDNGIGIPEDLDFRTTDSLGLNLVNILAEDQLKGEVTLDRNVKGTKFQIIFE